MISRKGRLSATYEENSEANTKVYDINQKTMQAFGTLAVVYATFEEARANLEIENSEGDPLYADERVATNEFATAQRPQARLQDELKSSRESLDIAVLDVGEAV